LATDPDDSAVTGLVHGFCTGQGPYAEEREQSVPVERRAVAERKTKTLPGNIAARGPSPECPWRHPVPLTERGIEAAEALEATGKGDAGYRKRRVGQQALGEKQAVGLRQLTGSHPELPLKHPPQMPRRDAKVGSKLRYTAAIEGTPLDAR